MWRSYYEKHRVRLFNRMSELLRSNITCRWLNRTWSAYYARTPLCVQGWERARGLRKGLAGSNQIYSYLHT